MKKYISLLLIFVIAVGLTGCGGDTDTAASTDTTAVAEVVDTYAEIENNGGMVITMDEDTIRALLGDFTSEQLRLSGDFFDYTLKLSAEEYNGMNGCRVEAIPAGGTTAERVYFVNGTVCMVYDDAQKIYVSITAPTEGDTTSSTDTVEGEPPVVNPPQSDVPVDFQYHEGNDIALHERFSQYDLSPVGMAKELSEYILVATVRTATVSGNKVSVIEVYEKDGTLTEYRLGLGTDVDYFYDYEAQGFVALSK